eukprot:Em0027g62a
MGPPLICSAEYAIRISRNIANYYKSSVGRDFKALAQMALFVLSPFLAPAEIEVWLALSKYKAFSYFTEEVQNPLASSSCYNTERNIYSNRQAPSKDIANSFAIQESIRFAFAESSYSLSERCGNDLIALYRSMGVQHYLGGTSVQHDKPIHQPGTLRKNRVVVENKSVLPVLVPSLGTRGGSSSPSWQRITRDRNTFKRSKFHH